jgi:hypothetical protein
MGLKSNAYASTMQGVAGAINSSKILVYSACTISTDCDETAAVETGNGLGNTYCTGPISHLSLGSSAAMLARGLLE